MRRDFFCPINGQFWSVAIREIPIKKHRRKKVMKLNQKVRYGVGCLFELSKNPYEYMEADEIAKRQTIPAAYAQKILQTLAHEGFVYSMKGLGYKLARPLGEITALSLIDSLSKDVDANTTNPDMG